MKPEPFIITEHPPPRNRFSEARAQALHGQPRQHPPPTRFPRYPSLSDDDYPPILSARLIAALILVAIILALALGA